MQAKILDNALEWTQKLYNYCEPYYAEIANNTHLIPCPETAINTFSTALYYNDDYTVFGVLDDQNNLHGVSIIVKGCSFFKGVEADVDFMYVRPDDRGSGSSRLLVERMRQWYFDNNITILYGGCATFLGGTNNKKYVNLYKKFGFKELGSIVCYTGDK